MLPIAISADDNIIHNYAKHALLANTIRENTKIWSCNFMQIV